MYKPLRRARLLSPAQTVQCMKNSDILTVDLIHPDPGTLESESDCVFSSVMQGLCNFSTGTLNTMPEIEDLVYSEIPCD